jgi:hypothetical protein
MSLMLGLSDLFLEKRSAGMKFRNKKKFRYNIPAVSRIVGTGDIRNIIACC